MKEVKFSYGDRHYCLNLDTKISILAGDSGSGKTALCNDVINANNIQDTVIVVIRDYGVDLSIYSSVDLVIIDEQILNKYITNKRVDLLNNNFKNLLIISRDSVRSLSYSYKSIYNLVKVNNIITLKRIL